jgi:hypothetical protein
MPVTSSPQLEYASLLERTTQQSLSRSRQTIANSLSIACPECAAKPGTYCVPSAGGFCQYRWGKALTLSIPAPLPSTATAAPGVPAPALALPGSKTQPDRRHPNRHPVRSAR